MAYTSDIDLVSATTKSATETGTPTSAQQCDLYRRANFAVKCSAGSGAGSATVDVCIQSYMGGGIASWNDIARFTLISISGALSTPTVRWFWDVGGTLGTGTTTVEEATETQNITVANKRAGPLGTQVRAIYTITITGTYSFTFAVTGSFVA